MFFQSAIVSLQAPACLHCFCFREKYLHASAIANGSGRLSMDSLFSKFGPLKALVPAKTGLHCEGSDASQMQSRSVQVCVCRSPSLQSKPNPATQAAQETSTCTSDPPFNPLPLPSPRTAIPAPLKFLWFSRKKKIPIENRASEQAQALHLSVINNGDLISSLPLLEQNTGEASSLGDLIERSNKQKEDTQSETLREGCDDAVLIQEMHHDSPTQPEIAASILSNAIMANVDPSCRSTKKSWISMITDLKSLWPNRKAPMNQIGSPDKSRTCSTPPNNGITSTHVPKCESSCGGCELNACHGCSLEVPYTKVLHSKESFSKFLQDASLFDMKVLAQMSFLCDIAYTIPDIQVLVHYNSWACYILFCIASMNCILFNENRVLEYIRLNTQYCRGCLRKHHHFFMVQNLNIRNIYLEALLLNTLKTKTSVKKQGCFKFLERLEAVFEHVGWKTLISACG